MKRILTIFIMIALCLFIACDITPPEGNDPEDTVKTGYVSPSAAKLGTLLRFFTTDSLPYPINEYQILFAGMDEFTKPDSFINNNLYVTLPFGAISGKVYMMLLEFDSSDMVNGAFPLKNCDTVFIPALQVDEISNPKDIRLTWFDLNYNIHKYNSQYRAFEGTGQNIEWQGRVVGDTTHLSANYQIGDVSYEHSISFYSIRGDESLPEFMNARSRSSYTWHGIDVIENDYFLQGVIKLQDWDPDTLVSGMIITTPGDMNNYYFWCDFSK